MKIPKEEWKKLFRFIFCSTTAWLADLLVFTIAYERLHFYYIASKAMSYSVGAMVSYCCNRKITFQTKSKWFSIKLLKFILVNCLAITLSLLSMYVFCDCLQLPVWGGYFLSILFSFGTNFLGNRFWVFRR